jgi:hypothetical protein
VAPEGGAENDLHHERMEVAYCRAWCEAATPEVAQACGLSFDARDGALVSVTSKVDFLSLNRALGVGVEVPATEERIEEILERFRSAGVPRCFFTVAPHARPPAITEWLSRRGFAPYNNWVKLGRAAGPAAPVESPAAVENGPAVPAEHAPSRTRIDEIGPEHAADFGRLAASRPRSSRGGSGTRRPKAAAGSRSRPPRRHPRSPPPRFGTCGGSDSRWRTCGPTGSGRHRQISAARSGSAARSRSAAAGSSRISVNSA